MNSTPAASVRSHRRRTSLRRDLGERLERLDHAHVAGVRPPAHLVAVVGSPRGRLALGVVEALPGRDPVDGALQAGVVEHPEADQAEGHVAGEARDDAAGQPAAALLAALDGEATRLGLLRVAEDGLAGGADPLVGGVRAQLGQHDQLPDAAAVLVGVETTRPAPVAVVALRGEDPRHGALGHDRAPCRLDLGRLWRLAEQPRQGGVAHRRLVGGEQPGHDVGGGRQNGPVGGRIWRGLSAVGGHGGLRDGRVTWCRLHSTSLRSPRARLRRCALRGRPTVRTARREGLARPSRGRPVVAATASVGDCSMEPPGDGVDARHGCPASKGGAGIRREEPCRC